MPIPNHIPAFFYAQYESIAIKNREEQKMEMYWYCSVAVKGIHTNYSYISDMGEIEEGTIVEVPFGPNDNLRIGIVKSCSEYTSEDAPYPVEKTKHIVRQATAEEYRAQKPVEWDYYDDNWDDDDPYYDIAMEDWDSVLDWAIENHDSDDPVTIKRVLKCYEHCVEQNMPVAALNLGTFYYTGRFLEQDYKKAFDLYKIAADAGERRAICNCGYCFYYGRHQEADYAEANRYFSLGALLFNDANCLYKLGDLYLNGYGVEKNENYAFKLFARALECSENNKEDSPALADAQFRVGKCLLRGIGTQKNVEDAHALLSIALLNFYKRRKTDPFVIDLIQETKELIAEAQEQLDTEIADYQFE